MTNKKIPEALCVRVDADGVPRIEDTSDGNCHIGFSYVRADLLQGDPNEPLAHGQFRWAKRYKVKCIWVMMRVAIDDDGTPYLISHDGLERKASKYAVIGPVIRPPADTAN